MTGVKHHVILPKMEKCSGNRFHQKLHIFLLMGGGGGGA